jgi:peptidoglycan/LPS O-acetylase OafA/YrhL
MKIQLRRIIQSGSFIPEIDGLRFIAITSVVLFHTFAFLKAKDSNTYDFSGRIDWIDRIISHGDFGVPLFFVISGFILGRPFAEYYFNHQKSVSIKSYFIRRLTRLEPPYILVMSGLFVASVFILHKMPLAEGLKSLACSLFYVHNFVYGREFFPLLNTVAWSLEVEVQFYILAPVLAAVFFRLPEPKIRRLIIVASILFFTCIEHFFRLPFISVMDFMEFFLIGFLLTDLYVNKSAKIAFLRGFTGSLLSIVLVFSLFVFETSDIDGIPLRISWEVYQLFAIGLAYYLILINKSLSILRSNVLTNIGGMCYSIYLLHFVLISLVGNPLFHIAFSKIEMVNHLLYATILTAVVLFVSTIFFLLVERPCMNKNWHIDLLNRLR